MIMESKFVVWDKSQMRNRSQRSKLRNIRENIGSW